MRTTTRLALVALVGLGSLVLAGCKNPITGEEFSPSDVQLTLRDALAANPDLTRDEVVALLSAEYGLTVPSEPVDVDGDDVVDPGPTFPDTDGNGIPDVLEQRENRCFRFEDANGDGVPDHWAEMTDSDGDGIPDKIEKMKDENANGTPDKWEGLPDANGDGIPDALPCDHGRGDSGKDANEDDAKGDRHMDRGGHQGGGQGGGHGGSDGDGGGRGGR